MTAPNKVYRCRACGRYASQPAEMGARNTCTPDCSCGIVVTSNGCVWQRPLAAGLSATLGVHYTDETRDWSRPDFEAAFEAARAQPFIATAAAIGKLVTEKNAAYGDAAAKSAAILSQLYPDGIAPEQYTNALLIVRVLDKLCRIAAGNDGAFGESAWIDISGYGILGATRAVQP